jgi:inner membrane protein
MTSDGVIAASNGGPRKAAARSADWGGKALLVCALAVLMAIPGVFVFALIADRAHRAESVVTEVSNLQGGPQQLLGPLLVAPYTYLNDDKHLVQGWYVVSPEEGQAALNARTETLHRGIFDVPTYNATADITARFGPQPTSLNLPPSAIMDWSHAQIIVGFSDLRGAKAEVAGEVTGPGGAKTQLSFAPSSAISLGQAAQPAGVKTPLNAAGFGLVATPAAPLLAAGGGVVHASLRFTGAQRLAVLPFAKTTHVAINGVWKSPSFDGGFLPETRQTAGSNFTAAWNVPFIARGLSDHASASDLSLEAMGSKDLGVTFALSNNPYENVMRALKYAVMFVGLVFLTFFVFEALSGRRLHPAQYVMIGLAQMVFYLLLLSLSEYVGFDIAFAAAAVATVGLIASYTWAAFQSRAFGVQALMIFSAVYGLIYLLMRLEDFALLAGSIASFVGLSTAMYLTRNIDWYGGKAEAHSAPLAPQPLAPSA